MLSGVGLGLEPALRLWLNFRLDPPGSYGPGLLALPGPPFITENWGGVYRRSMHVAVGPTGRVCGRVHSSLGHSHEDDLAVRVSRRRADGPFPKFGLQSAVWVYGFHDLDLLTSSPCFLVQPAYG